MPSDIPERIRRVKEHIALDAYLQSTGLKMQRAGNHWIALCPFHSEKTPSFHVHANRYHCFGCGAGGDIFDYIEKINGLTHSQALELLERGGTVPLNSPRPTPAPAPDKAPEPLSPSLLGAWQVACEKLAGNPAEIRRIADWRGFSPDTILGAAEYQLMAKWDYFGQSREAFLVCAPAAFFDPALVSVQSFPILPHAIHCRLGPNTSGNPHPKQSWRYHVKGSKAWPFLWGDITTARYLFILEGQWDALALADLCGWHRPDRMPKHTCIIGLRGATSWKLMLHPQHGLPIDPAAAAICIGDTDTAGDRWYEKDGFLATLKTRVRKLITFRPTAPGCKDFNDVTRSHQLTAADFLAWVKKRLRRHPWQQAGPPLSFIQWCKATAQGTGSHAAAAKLILCDKTRPKGRKSPSHWRTYWRTQHHDEATLLALHTLLDLWKTHTPPPP